MNFSPEKLNQIEQQAKELHDDLPIPFQQYIPMMIANLRYLKTKEATND